MIPALLSLLGGKFLSGAAAGLTGSSAGSAASGLAGTPGGAMLQQFAPTLMASGQGAPEEKAPGLLDLQSPGQSPQMQMAQLPGYAQATKLNRPYQRQYRGLLQ